MKQADDLRGRAQGVDKLRRSKDGKDREKAVREVLGMDSPLSDAIDAASEARDDLQEVANAKTEWPECDGGDAYADGLMATYKHGDGSKQARAAWANYAAHLKAYHKIIDTELDALLDIQDQLPLRKKAAAQLVSVSDALNTGFEHALKLPLPSAMQAQIFTLSEDSGLLYSQALNVQRLLGQIEKRATAELKEGNAILAQNAKWLAWAAKASGLSLDEIKRNAKARAPR